MDIQGQVNLTNNSGVDYKNVNLDFVLGDVHTLYYNTPVKPQPTCEVKNESGIHIASEQMVVNGNAYKSTYDDRNGMIAHRAAGLYGDFVEKSGMIVGKVKENIYDLKDFYVYHLPFQVQLMNDAPTMATFLSGKNIPYQKEYVFSNLINVTYSQKSKNVAPQLYLNFDTKTLNLPLPQGDFRVFNKHKDQMFFVGESRVDTITMPNQKARVNMGNALDIYADTQLIDYRDVSDEAKIYTHEITVRNLAKESKRVQVKQNLSTEEDRLQESSVKPTSATPALVTWEFALKPEATKKIVFSVMHLDLALIRRKQEKQFDDELCKKKVIRLQEK